MKDSQLINPLSVKMLIAIHVLIKSYSLWNIHPAFKTCSLEIVHRVHSVLVVIG